LNSPETILFTKGAVLFGLHKSKRALIDRKQAIVCEGQVDLITAFEAGVQNVIAPQGTAFTDRQARILKRYVDEVMLCFDSDAAGEKAAERSLRQLMAEGLQVRVVQMPPGEDPDSLIRREGADAFRSRIAESRDFFEAQIERQASHPDFTTPRGRIAAARKLAELISLIPDGVMRDVVLNNAAVRLEVGAQDLRKLLKQAPDSRPGDDAAGEAAQRIEPIVLDRTRGMLALLALRDDAARTWLQEARAAERLPDDGQPGTLLLQKVLSADIRIADPASVNAWLSTLDAAEEAAVSVLLSEKLPPDAARIVEQFWAGIEREALIRKREALIAACRAPNLPLEQLAEINRQMIQLQQQIAALAGGAPVLAA
jgi:DNA primase